MAVQRLAYIDIAENANNWLRHHHQSFLPPTPIEEIISEQYGLDIIPVQGMQASTGIDGFLAADSSIYIDEFVYMNRVNRARFTLAHEIAHVVLHADYINVNLPQSIEEADQLRKTAIRETSNWTDEDVREWQAYCWAGLVLVPQRTLAVSFNAEFAKHKQKIQQALAAGLNENDYLPIVYELVCSPIANIFQVSTEVVARRIEFDGLLNRRIR